MNFAEAFTKTLGKDLKTSEAPAKQSLDQGITTDEMQKYIDAKFEGFQKQIDTKMNDFLAKNNIESSSDMVETPEETHSAAEENIEKEGE